MKDNKYIAIDFLFLIGEGKIEQAFDAHVAKDFKHHNPHLKGDADSLMQAMKEDAIQNPEKELKILRAVSDMQGVGVHSIVKQNPNHSGFILAHFFSFEKGKITELWDLGQEIPANIINENGLV